jgi:hypothetical protein
MKITDINQTLKQPEGFELYDVRADGAYLRLEYNKTIYVEATRTAKGWKSVIIYLNDFGREVVRTEAFIKIAPLLPTPLAVPPKPWYFKLADMFLNALNA